MKKLLGLIFNRIFWVVAFMLLQLAVFLLGILFFLQYTRYFYIACMAFAIVLTLFILNSKSNPSYKIAWILPILIAPLFGSLIYLVFGQNKLSKSEKKKMNSVLEKAHKAQIDDSASADRLADISKDAYLQSNYIRCYADSSIYQNTETTFLPLGEIKHKHLLEELAKAEHFIFMEYFIIQEGIMWNSILDILKEKATAGVDVRIIYDDLGTASILPYHYNQRLEEMGIHCCIFNEFIPVLSPRFNNRDHRKICVIDGKVGFTGGINLADEYINAYPKHGHWKDCSVMLRGDAVTELTIMFLSMWNTIRKTDEDFTKFITDQPVYNVAADSFVQPYNDTPLDDESTGENVYLNMISRAKEYLYITTPYLIIDNEMISALTNAAKQGVDVRIITPHIADKWYVHSLTRAHYEILTEGGVRIYEYTPGFIHSKVFVSDDDYCTVGTINLDYRSLYLHFECGVWMYRTECVAEAKADFFKTLEQCEEITLEDCRKVSWYKKLFRSVLRAFAPLM